MGRPRTADRQRRGATPREEILDAAAELFTVNGYSATSTRLIAEAVGVRQASLYYHFSSKEDLLGELLAATVRGALAAAEQLAGDRRRPDLRLYSLATYDVSVLLGSRWNLGALYLLPEARTGQFASFWADRARLRAHYGQLVSAVTGRPDGLELDLVFGLVESVITLRSQNEELDRPAVTRAVAAGCLRLVGVKEARIQRIEADAFPDGAATTDAARGPQPATSASAASTRSDRS